MCGTAAELVILVVLDVWPDAQQGVVSCQQGGHPALLAGVGPLGCVHSSRLAVLSRQPWQFLAELVPCVR